MYINENFRLLLDVSFMMTSLKGTLRLSIILELNINNLFKILYKP